MRRLSITLFPTTKFKSLTLYILFPDELQKGEEYIFEIS